MALKISLFFLLGFLPVMAAPKEQKVMTRALYSWIDQKTGDLILKGSARIERDGVLLEADEILYNDRRKEAFATGNTRLSNKDFTLESGQLKVYLPGATALQGMLEEDMVAIAQKSPRLVGAPDESGRRNQVTAVEIKFYKGSEKVEAFENVRLLQFSTDGLRVKEELSVTGNYLEYLNQDKRALVKGRVKLSAKELGAEGERLIYYQKDQRFYVIGDASVHQLDPNGKVQDTVRGSKILHILNEKRTILMGNVEGQLGGR